MSTKGALLCILGEIDRALSTLNEILRNDPNHYLALMRRSQVYKKVSQTIQAEALPPVDVKGKEKPLQVYKVIL